MGLYRKEDRAARSAGILISILVRYPEVGMVKYEPQHQTIHIGLLIGGEMPEEEWRQTRHDFLEMLEVYHLLEQRVPTALELKRDSYGELTSVTIVRDVRSCTPEEVYTIIEFFRERFRGRLAAEVIDYGTEDDMIAQDELIEDILVDLEAGRSGRHLIAIREEGRLMVFQK